MPYLVEGGSGYRNEVEVPADNWNDEGFFATQAPEVYTRAERSGACYTLVYTGGVQGLQKTRTPFYRSWRVAPGRLAYMGWQVL